MKTIDKIITKVDGSRGAPMGRCNKGSLPPIYSSGPNARVFKCNQITVFDCFVPMSDDCYDKGGAYWGSGARLRVAYTKDLSFIKFYRENANVYNYKSNHNQLKGDKMNKQLNNVSKRYILNAIDASGYTDKEPKTIQDKITFLKETFQAEYGWHIKQVGETTALKNWLQGLPSCINIVFYNDEILELAKRWKQLSTNPTEKQEDKILDNYWNFMAVKIHQLFTGYQVPKDLN